MSDDEVRLVMDMLQSVQAWAGRAEVGQVVSEFDQPFRWELIHSLFRIVCRRDQGQVGIARVWCSARLLQLPK